MNDEPRGEESLQDQVDDLKTRVKANRAMIDALEAGAEIDRRKGEEREVRADAVGKRVDRLEERAYVDRAVVAQLQLDGEPNRQQSAQMEAALRSSRRIGAAIGIVMANRQVTEEAAFSILKEASNTSNRKLRDVADEVVLTGEVSDLPSLASPTRQRGGLRMSSTYSVPSA